MHQPHDDGDFHYMEYFKSEEKEIVGKKNSHRYLEMITILFPSIKMYFI